jgi:hypothetical protein
MKIIIALYAIGVFCQGGNSVVLANAWLSRERKRIGLNLLLGGFQRIEPAYGGHVVVSLPT